MFQGPPRRVGLLYLTHARGSHGDPRNNHLGDADGCSSLRAEKVKLSGMTLSSSHGLYQRVRSRLRARVKSEMIKGKGWTHQGLGPNPTLSHLARPLRLQDQK